MLKNVASILSKSTCFQESKKGDAQVSGLHLFFVFFVTHQASRFYYSDYS